MRISWAQLYEEIGACRKCRLCETRNNVVPGEGNPHAKLMFIGEGPGQDEDRQGRPFVGRSGELLTRMIHAIGMERSEVYICNIVKCRPPRNRVPEEEEAAACKLHLRNPVALVHPKVIVLLGSTAAKNTLGPDIRITRDRGRWFNVKGTWMLPTYHPSALLRDPAKKREAWEDMQTLRDKLIELGLYEDIYGGNA